MIFRAFPKIHPQIRALRRLVQSLHSVSTGRDTIPLIFHCAAFLAWFEFLTDLSVRNEQLPNDRNCNATEFPPTFFQNAVLPNLCRLPLYL
jgi:hypothetical protein